MTAPIDKLLDRLEWVACEGEAPNDGGLYATHHGVLTIGDQSLRVYQLNNGQRVIEQGDFGVFFDSLLATGDVSE